MNKKMLLVGAVAIAGFATLTAFGGRTKAQQDADIAAAVEARLTEIKAEESKKCDDRVMAEATTRFDAAWAAKMEEASRTVPVKKGATTKKGSGPSKPATLPPATKPVDPAQAKKDKTAGTPAPANTEAKQSKTAGEAPAPNTSAKKAKTAGQTGGGN
jgi:hypothetical protein